MDGSRGAPMIFSGVRFSLSGFDSVSEAQYRSVLVSGGGIEAGRGDTRCTHVIVFGLFHDDPVCASARRNGKLLVTETWVDDCLSSGELVDATRVLYRPVRDLNGIPGCEGFCICLTGYQRQERDDIMRMASLMGAEFSKPLVANKVTHLICYKFEGEKYELAKKFNIKLVNHRWLEDCLKAWEVLLVDNYTKSTWELEVLEAEARDSEEETEEDRDILKQKIPTFVPSVPHSEGPSTFRSPTKNNVQQGDKGEKQPLNTEVPIEERLSMPCKGFNPLDTCIRGRSSLNDFARQDAGFTPQGSHGDMEKQLHKGTESIFPSEANSNHNGRALSLTEKVIKSNLPDIAIDEKAAIVNFSTKNLNKLDSSGEVSGVLQDFPEVNVEKNTLKDRSSQLDACMGKTNNPSAEVSLMGNSTHIVESAGTSLPRKRKSLASRGTAKFLKSGSEGSPHNAQQSMRFIDSNLTTSFPEDIEGHDISHTGTSSGAASGRTISLKSTEKPQAIESKSKFLNYKKRCVKRGKTPSMDNILNTTKTSEAKSVDMSLDSESIERLVCEIPVNALPLDSEPSGTAEPTKSDKLVQDLLLDDQIQAAEMTHSGNERSVGKSIIGKGRSDDNLSAKNNTASSFGDLQVSDLVAGMENHGHSLTPKVQYKEPLQQPPQTKDDEGFGSETEKFSDKMDDICSGKKPKHSYGAYKKKVVYKKKLIGRPKLELGNNNEDGNIITSDKTSQKKETKTYGNDGVLREELGQAVKTGIEKNKPTSLVSHKETYTDDNVHSTQSPLPKKRSKNTKASKIHKKKERAADENNQKMDVDSGKENIPNDAITLTKDYDNETDSKATNKHEKLLKGSRRKENALDRRKHPSRCKKSDSSEPAWFIFSGHRMQRKEFQILIRRLKGRLCRDSHQWSYQATHFIVPDPVRRTEKFFAAAASGRWILKTDYLSASNEAGKLLDEESFEWYRKGLNEDGAISLEAPRKWRKLKERTEHGAFYGMKIIIYGDCFVPSLDTLKRAVKAGDGTILATAPPYTRFLKSDVDYAVISTGMPRVDAWVQEFLRHEIPCVLADYLVDHVCKPGYPLDKHVLYNTHAWAEKSFANLSSRLETSVDGA